MKGTVKFFNDMKGFGFIAGDDGKEYFVHQTGILNHETLKENDFVEFEVIQGDRGPKADKVTKVTAEPVAEEESTEDNSEEDIQEAA